MSAGMCDSDFLARTCDAMCVVALDTWDPELRDEAYEIYGAIKDRGATDETSDEDEDQDQDQDQDEDEDQDQDQDQRAEADLKSRVVQVRRAFVRSSVFDPSVPGHAEIPRLLDDLAVTGTV
jgi:hypothetical protein